MPRVYVPDATTALSFEHFGGLFHRCLANETEKRPNETSFSLGDNIMKPGGIMVGTTNFRVKRPHKQGTVMIKALSAVVIAGFMALAITVLPGFAPQVEASTQSAPLAKADRLDIHTVGVNCSQNAWPNFEASCLKRADRGMVQEARLVTADRR